MRRVRRREHIDYRRALKVAAAVISGWCDMISIGPGQARASASNLHSAGGPIGGLT